MLIKGKRRGLSAPQKAELWNRWKAGQSLNEIGRALGRDHVVVHFVLARHGGIAPPARRRSRRARGGHRDGRGRRGHRGMEKVAKPLFLFALQYLSYFRCELAYDIRKRAEYSLCHHRLIAASPGVVASWLPS
jgi:hypothetical protein